MIGMARDPSPKPLGGVIEKLRITKGLTRRALAEKASTKYSTVYNLEKGFNPRTSVEMLSRIANALGVPVTEITAVEVPA